MTLNLIGMKKSVRTIQQSVQRFIAPPAGDPSFLVELGIEELIPAPSLHIAGINDLTVPFYEPCQYERQVAFF